MGELRSDNVPNRNLSLEIVKLKLLNSPDVVNVLSNPRHLSYTIPSQSMPLYAENDFPSSAGVKIPHGPLELALGPLYSCAIRRR